MGHGVIRNPEFLNCVDHVHFNGTSSRLTDVRKVLARHVRKHDDHTFRLFLLRTVSAQLHLFGLFTATAVFAVLMYLVWSKTPTITHVLACAIFGITGISVFASSSLYHFMADGFQISDKANSWLNNYDHFSIYFFIAGTYTAFIVNAIQPPWDTYLLVTVWSLALIGMTYTIIKTKLPQPLQSRYLSTALFVALGWTLCLRISEAWAAIDSASRFYLTAGGLAYTLGAVVYATKKPDPFPNRFGYHELWHIAVLLGFAMHAILILRFYL